MSETYSKENVCGGMPAKGLPVLLAPSTISARAQGRRGPGPGPILRVKPFCLKRAFGQGFFSGCTSLGAFRFELRTKTPEPSDFKLFKLFGFFSLEPLEDL